MNRAEAFRRAKEALDTADEAQSRACVESGDGWGAMASSEIYTHVLGYLEHAFNQGPKPDDYPPQETSDD